MEVLRHRSRALAWRRATEEVDIAAEGRPRRKRAGFRCDTLHIALWVTLASTSNSSLHRTMEKVGFEGALWSRCVFRNVRSDAQACIYGTGFEGKLELLYELFEQLKCNIWVSG